MLELEETGLIVTRQRDEEVGIYGFIFHRDTYWVPVIVDE